jgi:hypothetical protein
MMTSLQSRINGQYKTKARLATRLPQTANPKTRAVIKRNPLTTESCQARMRFARKKGVKRIWPRAHGTPSPHIRGCAAALAARAAAEAAYRWRSDATDLPADDELDAYVDEFNDAMNCTDLLPVYQDLYPQSLRMVL